MGKEEKISKKIGELGYVDENCWLAKTLGYPPGKRCERCELKFSDCLFFRYLKISLGLTIFLFILSFLIEGEISKLVVISVFVLVIVYGRFFNKTTNELIEAYFIQRKARIELEELNKAKDQFILTTQHHLRTPLTVIKGYIGVLKDLPSLPGEAVSAVNKIDNHADDLAKFINDLLQITEVEITKKDETKSD